MGEGLLAGVWEILHTAQMTASPQTHINLFQPGQLGQNCIQMARKSGWNLRWRSDHALHPSVWGNVSRQQAPCLGSRLIQWGWRLIGFQDCALQTTWKGEKVSAGRARACCIMGGNWRLCSEVGEICINADWAVSHPFGCFSRKGMRVTPEETLAGHAIFYIYDGRVNIFGTVMWLQTEGLSALFPHLETNHG